MACLSVSVQVDEEHVAPTPPDPRALAKVRALIAGQEAWMRGLGGGSVVIPDQSLRIYVFRLTQHPPPRVHLLWKCAALSHGGGDVQSKHSTDESGEDGIVIHLVIISPRDLGPSRFAEGTSPSVLESQTTNKQTIK